MRLIETIFAIALNLERPLKILNNVGLYKNARACALTIGTYDGVHLGHRRIVEQVVNLAKKQRLTAVVLTFYPHPRQVLNKHFEIKLIDTLNEKEALLRELGIDYLIAHPFTLAFSQLSPKEYVSKILVNKLNVSQLVVGYNHRFGYKCMASTESLTAFGKQFGFKVHVSSPYQVKGTNVSSTKIRTALSSGQIELANQYLGRPYRLTGKVISGDGIGQKLGYPTANLAIHEDKLLPQAGVYFVSSNIDEKKYSGMMNIGVRPTFSSNNIQIEVHFFDLNCNLYERHIVIELLEKIRDEQKFNSKKELVQQLQKDAIKCQKIKVAQ